MLYVGHGESRTGLTEQIRNRSVCCVLWRFDAWSETYPLCLFANSTRNIKATAEDTVLAFTGSVEMFMMLFLQGELAGIVIEGCLEGDVIALTLLMDLVDSVKG